MARGQIIGEASSTERTAGLSRFSPLAWAARHGIHYAWIVVGVTFFAVLVSAGVRAAPAVLIEPLESEFGWRRSQISLAISLSLLTYGLASPSSGWLLDRLGIRGIAISFLGIAVIGVAATSFVNSLWQMNAFWGVVGMGTGGVAGVIGAAVASTWFESRRGLVTGVLGGAMSAGQLVFLPIVRWLTDTYSWRTAIVFLAVLLGGVVWPLVLLLIRSRPADVGLKPYGAGSMGAAALAQEQRSTPISQAVRTADFWLLAMSFGVCGFTTMGLIGTHFVPHAVEHGFTRSQATWILAILGAFNVVGTMASGWLCDRYSPRMLLASYYFFRALSLLALPFISNITVLPIAFMSGFAVIFGLDYIATVPPTVLLVAERFGRRSMGTIYGWITFVHMAGGAAAAYFAGWVHDKVGEYAPAFYIAGVLGLLAAAMAFSVRPRRGARVAAGVAAG